MTMTTMTKQRSLLLCAVSSLLLTLSWVSTSDAFVVQQQQHLYGRAFRPQRQTELELAVDPSTTFCGVFVAGCVATTLVLNGKEGVTDIVSKSSTATAPVADTPVPTAVVPDDIVVEDEPDIQEMVMEDSVPSQTEVATAVEVVEDKAEPVSVPAPKPAPAPVPKPVVVAAPKPVVVPAPKPVVVPAPKPVVVAAPKPVVVPAPKPVVAPPIPAPKPVAVVTPPAPKPAPTPVAETTTTTKTVVSNPVQDISNLRKQVASTIEGQAKQFGRIEEAQKKKEEAAAVAALLDENSEKEEEEEVEIIEEVTTVVTTTTTTAASSPTIPSMERTEKRGVLRKAMRVAKKIVAPWRKWRNIQ